MNNGVLRNRHSEGVHHPLILTNRDQASNSFTVTENMSTPKVLDFIHRLIFGDY